MFVLLCEHFPTITISRRAAASSHLLSTKEILNKEKISVFDTDRGGDITYHGPGQLVAYPILDLNRLSLKLDSYLRILESVVIQTISKFNLTGLQDSSATGVWIKNNAQLEKICAIGIRATRWVSMHGLALNVTTNLNHYKHIIPCGLHGRPVTSMEKLLGYSLNIDEVKKTFKIQMRTTIKNLDQNLF
tara:strand:+ start:571 stop:1137 length:567 start_codon:yes stop_codon:yes gene_type:complete